MKTNVLFALVAMTGSFVIVRPSAAASAASSVPSEKVDQAVIASLPTWKGNQAQVLAHVDLTSPFTTSSQWTFVVAQDPTPPPTVLPNGDVGHGPLAVCFVKAAVPQCVEGKYGEGYMSWSTDVYNLMENKIVYASDGNKQPLLWLKTCSTNSGDGDCGIRVALFGYDAKQDRFVPVFSRDVGDANRNNNARYMENGPLRGDVIVDHPAEKAPYMYWIEVFALGKSGKYSQILRYRGHTGYGDGNQLPVAYSEMPEILRRLGVWHPGDSLPIPPNLDCPHPTLRHGEEWCQ